MTIRVNMPHLSSRKTKIIATLGPASDTQDVIYKLIEAGVNVFRLNMSHGEHDSHRRLYQLIRESAAALNLHVAIFADLCGPKIRTGRFKDGSIILKKGDQLVVTTRDVIGEDGLIPCQYRALADDVTVGDRILLDDGKFELRVRAKKGQDIDCEVIYGGELKNNKGINLPGVNVSCPSLTEKDRADALFALDLGVDYLALSFVRKAEDITDLRQLIVSNGYDTHIIAKIEKPEALTNGQDIIKAADAIMIARGDLGVELNPEDVPIAQRQLIKTARVLNKPVIVATQMLESMIESSRPTRAEVADISNAVYSSTDAVMLSGETAAGYFPVEAVEIMSKVIKQTEAFMREQDVFGKLAHRENELKPLPFGDAVADATAQLCFDLHAKAIVSITSGGMSVVTLSSARPAAPLIAISANKWVCQRMNLYWGVVPMHSEEAGHAHPNKLARRYAIETELANVGDNVVVVRGFHQDSQLNSPTITMLTL
ncbi:MAG: pyruvate kinase [Methylobacter sp.]|nr:pyruvate kinase [Methylobacter sp.]MDP2428078.1 pyruvate kinase [Methylobacter sp.]MDP3055117.1 pyruvate kinase [Methylobacter sp.]MDP3362746.1 pyruvate kinase [Methylobacter sp.]MDZ4217660.1 pyruvate kinase [Methylobacter sp.]